MKIRILAVAVILTALPALARAQEETLSATVQVDFEAPQLELPAQKPEPPILYARLPGKPVPAAKKASHWYTDKWTYIEFAAMGLGDAADAATAAHGARAGLTETNMFLPAHPSAAQLAGGQALKFVVVGALHIASRYVMRNDPSKTFRVLSHLDIPAISVGGSLYGVASNLTACHQSPACR